MPTSLTDLVAALAELAPLELAEDWDNVGLLVEVPDAAPIDRAVLTIDLTERVLDEAIRLGAGVIVAYHPPIFAKLGRLTLAEPKERIILRAVRAGISIYSPHTALDAAPGGVNDWLCDAFGAGTRSGIPEPTADDPRAIGRRLELAAPLALDDCAARVKAHLGLEHIRVAACLAHRQGATIASVALCAGAGGAVLEGQQADLWFTGEMRHHDVLAALARGTSVILCDHTNTERGYLPVLRDRLTAVCPGLELRIADDDEEPLRVV